MLYSGRCKIAVSPKCGIGPEKGAKMASKVIVEVPDNISEPTKKKAHQAAVLALWEAGELSTGEAAEELSLTHHDFLDLLAAQGIPVESGPLNLKAIEAARQKLTTGRP